MAVKITTRLFHLCNPILDLLKKQMAAGKVCHEPRVIQFFIPGVDFARPKDALCLCSRVRYPYPHMPWLRRARCICVGFNRALVSFSHSQSHSRASVTFMHRHRVCTVVHSCITYTANSVQWTKTFLWTLLCQRLYRIPIDTYINRVNLHTTLKIIFYVFLLSGELYRISTLAVKKIHLRVSSNHCYSIHFFPLFMSQRLALSKHSPTNIRNYLDSRIVNQMMPIVIYR